MGAGWAPLPLKESRREVIAGVKEAIKLSTLHHFILTHDNDVNDVTNQGNVEDDLVNFLNDSGGISPSKSDKI